MPTIEGTRNLKSWVGEYDFAIDGGAVGAITLRSEDGPIPNNSYIIASALDVLTAFTTAASGQAAVAVNSAGDLIAAAVVSGAPYSTTGLKSTTQVGTGATMIKTTAARSPTITISVGAITAGKCRLVITYR